MRTTLPLILGFLVGIVMVGEFFIPAYQFRILTSILLEFGLVIASGAFVLGLFNLVQVNLPKVVNREEDWSYKLIMLISLVVTMVAGFWGGLERNDAGVFYRWIFDYVMTPLNATMFALLAFYIASAAFRAFRARNLEATVLLAAACLVMFARVPIGAYMGELVTGGDYLVQVQNWIMSVPNFAARRSIFIGAALGAIATGLRVILGIERSHLGGE